MSDDFLVTLESDSIIVDVCRDVDIASADSLRAKVASFDSLGFGAIIVDLTSCKYIDSTGLRLLIGLHRDGRNLIVVLPAEHQLQHMFQITGLKGYLRFATSRGAALSS